MTSFRQQGALHGIAFANRLLSVTDRDELAALPDVGVISLRLAASQIEGTDDDIGDFITGYLDVVRATFPTAGPSQ